MLIHPLELTRYWNIRPKGVIHVGAHLAEEANQYSNLGWNKILPTIWIEAHPQLVEQLSNSLDKNFNRLISGAASNTHGKEINLIVTNNTQSSSLLPLGSHMEYYPDIREVERIKVRTIRVDEIVFEADGYDFVNLDIQGTELEALQGFGELLTSFKYIYSEVNREEIYKNCTLVDELDSFLKFKEFTRVRTVWTSNNWGDAIWIKNGFLPKFWKLRSAIHSLATLSKSINPMLLIRQTTQAMMNRGHRS